MVKNPSRDMGSIPALGRSPGKGNSNHSSLLARKISWTEEPGRLQSIARSQLSDETTNNKKYMYQYIDIDIYKTESLFCTAEINTTL